jgi:protein tyrosine phosphatase (PTP) superfamily phosphohydrolase (DUF442 family)
MRPRSPSALFGCRSLLVILAIATASAVAQPAAEPPPNVVPISEFIVTSGQPSAAWLAELKARGFAAVIYLAPPTVGDAVRDEGLIVARQGLTYINIPIRFDGPTDADFQAFSGAMKGLASRKVLVHCQVNLRASSMTFLYRAIVLKEKPDVAYEAVAGVWSPDGAWKKFIAAQLARNGIAFDPF